MIGYLYSNFCGSYYSWYRQMVEMANRESHRAFLARKLRSARTRKTREEQALQSMALTAVNRTRLRVPIRQPVWRAGRWKSLT